MSTTARSSGLAGHPPGLSTLFFTEFWERFSYYGMRALLILYMTAAATSGGLGMPTEQAAHIYGLYTSAVYLTAIPGGLIADRLLGARRAVLWGGITIALGHYSLALNQVPFFYAGLVLIVIGTGLLKPNISVMVGHLYGEDDARRDAGFSIFYMGINLGALTAPLVCSTLGEKVGWHWGFGAAGVGMTLGIAQYVLGARRLGDAGLRIGTRATAAAAPDVRRPDEGQRLAAIVILFVFSCLFWAGFEQAGSSLNLFARDLTRKSVFGHEFAAGYFQSANPMFIVLLAPAFAWLWVRLGRREPSSPAKFVYGLVFVGLGFLVMAGAARVAAAEGRPVSPLWLIACYLLHTIGELCLSPVGLSTVTKLAPARLVGLMMGVWFLSLSIGNYIGGQVAGKFEVLPLPQLFGTVALTTIVAGLILAALVPFIKKLMGGIN
jgi:POT family proton-dependent oligopeptide transporter